MIQAFGIPSAHQYELVDKRSINGCLWCLVNDEVDYAVVPLENSTNGNVNFTWDALRDLFHKVDHDQAKGVPVKDIKMGIVGEEFVGIKHCLITEAPSLDKIKRVYSHPQVWGQVDWWYQENLNGVEQLDCPSTSSAVELVKGDPTSAAIASSSAAYTHKVPVLVPNISNSDTNETRFLVFYKEKREKWYKGDEYNTIISFAVEHEHPGSLCRVLESFAKQNVNLSNIQSRPRPLGSTPWTYIFFLELHGHETDGEVSTALEDARAHCTEMHVLGSFKRNRAIRN